MNNKGFTMVELLMVIAILTMLALFATPNVIKLINKNKADNYNSTIDSIIEVAKVYVSDNRYDLEFKDEYLTGNITNCFPNSTNKIYASVTLEDLIKNKDINNVTKNPCNKADVLPSEISIKIILDCKTTNFDFELIDSGNNFYHDTTGKIYKITTCS